MPVDHLHQVVDVEGAGHVGGEPLGQFRRDLLGSPLPVQGLRVDLVPEGEVVLLERLEDLEAVAVEVDAGGNLPAPLLHRLALDLDLERPQEVLLAFPRRERVELDGVEGEGAEQRLDHRLRLGDLLVVGVPHVQGGAARADHPADAHPVVELDEHLGGLAVVVDDLRVGLPHEGRADGLDDRGLAGGVRPPSQDDLSGLELEVLEAEEVGNLQMREPHGVPPKTTGYDTVPSDAAFVKSSAYKPGSASDTSSRP